MKESGQYNEMDISWFIKVSIKEILKQKKGQEEKKSKD